MSENDKSGAEVLDTQQKNSDQKKRTLLIIAIVAVAVAVILWLFLYKIPQDQAVAYYDNAVEGYNSAVEALADRNAKLDDSIESLLKIIKADDLPLDETLLEDANIAIKDAQEVQKDKAPEISEMPSETNAINSKAFEIETITEEVGMLGDYTSIVKNLNDTQSVLETLLQNFQGATSEVIWLGTEDNPPFLRFLAEITNPNAEALTGVEAEWVAFDKDGFIVFSYDRSGFPIIPDNSHIYYVGGAGSANLTGIPDRIELTIKNGGIMTTKEAPNISVSNIQIVNEGYGGYSVTADCETDTDIETFRLDGQIVVKDSDGQIVYSEFWSPDNLPATLSAGGKFRISEYVMNLSSVPASAEVYMYHGDRN